MPFPSNNFVLRSDDENTLTAFSRHMEQTGTYWPPAFNDGFGGMTFSAPVIIKCRWQDKAVMFRDAQSREAVSDAIVYTDRHVQVGGFLALGIHTTVNPHEVRGAKEIRQIERSPSLRADEVLNKALL